MKKWILPLTIVAALIAAGANWFYRPMETHEHDVHYHAGFEVYVDGKRQDFTDFKYMEIEPCGTEHEEETPEHEQQEKAHLHDGVGDVVHVHRDGAKWKDLFTNIGYDLPDEKMVGYIDGKKIMNPLNQPILQYSTLVLLFGDTPESRGAETISLEHIKAVEAASESCGGTS